jgi:hypothetical protein
MRSVGGEDCYSGARGESVDCGFVCVGVGFVIFGVGVERGIESVVDLRDVFVEMLA